MDDPGGSAESGRREVLVVRYKVMPTSANSFLNKFRNERYNVFG